MSYFLSPIGNSQISDANGNPLVGGTIETYLAGTSTSATTYTSITGGTAQGVVMTLNSLGLPTNGPVWMLGGVALKFIIKNASGVAQSTFDYISGIGDASADTGDWTLFGASPTYVSATSFTVVGDQTNTFQPLRRLQSVNSGGTVYSTVFTSVFSAGVTTIVVTNTSGVLDTGLSAVSYGPASNNPAIPAIYPIRSFLAGLVLSTAGGSATMSIAAGTAVDSTNTTPMNLSAIAKTTSAWSVGTAAGGLDTGAIANNTGYHFYVIRRPDTGVVDVVFSTSASSPTLPANYTQYRRIGWGRTNGSAQWLAFVQDGDKFFWLTPIADVSVNNPGTSAVTRTLSTPSGVNTEALLQVVVANVGAGGNVYSYFSDLAGVDVLPNINFTDTCVAASAPGATSVAAGRLSVRTNTSAQIRSRLSFSDANTSMVISTCGWVDTRGRNA